MNRMDMEVRRLLAHIDRNAARRFLTNPEPPTGWADFQDSRTDHIGLVQREAKSQPYSAARFDAELRRLLEKEKQIEANKRADALMKGSK